MIPPMTESPGIRARPSRSIAVGLLEAEGLPTSDLADAHLEHFFFAGSDAAPTALVGLEIYGADALLRSLVVSTTTRSQGWGSALVAHAEAYAAMHQVSAIYLLTTTAEGFFARRGYRRVDRSRAPRAIQGTPEFSSLCPSNSTLMVKQL
jgi:amino-acid N-acetyltransferase